MQSENRKVSGFRIDMPKNQIRFNVIFFILIICLIWSNTPNILYVLFGDIKDAENFSNQFEVLNALFSGLAFAAIIVTLNLQRKELENQHKQLEDTQKNYNQQKFETTFFNLLSFQRYHLSNIWADVKRTKSKTGSEPIITFENKVGEKALYEIKRGLDDKISKIALLHDGSIDKLKFLNVINEFFSVDFVLNFSSYFESLQFLVQYIMDQKDIDHISYIKIVSTQLTSIEKYYLFHYLVCNENTSSGFNSYNKYLVTNLPAKLFIIESHRQFYYDKVSNTFEKL